MKDTPKPEYIVIQEWQNYLGLYLDQKPRVYPQWLPVSRHDYRYGNAVNVCRYSSQMAAFLQAEGIRFNLIHEEV